MNLSHFLSRIRVLDLLPLDLFDELAHIVLIYDNSCCIGRIRLMTQGTDRKHLKYN